MKFRFAEFEFDPFTCELTRQGSAIPLQPQPSKVLAALIQRPGQVLSRRDLQSEVWDESTHIDSQQGLNWCIRPLGVKLLWIIRLNSPGGAISPS